MLAAPPFSARGLSRFGHDVITHLACWHFFLKWHVKHFADKVVLRSFEPANCDFSPIEENIFELRVEAIF